MEELSPLQPFGDCYEIFKSANQTGETAEKVAQCKHLARDIKKKRATRGSLPTDFLRQSLPERQVMDALVELYFNTFEWCFRILHLLFWHSMEVSVMIRTLHAIRFCYSFPSLRF